MNISFVFPSELVELLLKNWMIILDHILYILFIHVNSQCTISTMTKS